LDGWNYLRVNNDSRYVYRFSNIAPGIKGMMDVVRDVFFNNRIIEEIFYKHENILSVPGYIRRGGPKGYDLKGLKGGDEDLGDLQKQIDDLEEKLELAKGSNEKNTGSRRELMAQRAEIRKQKLELEKKIDKITGKGEAEL